MEYKSNIIKIGNKELMTSGNREVMNIETITNDDTRDVSIRIVDFLINNEFIKYKEGNYPFEIQDEIHEEINNLINISEQNEQVIIESKINKL
ncbi:MAG: hypothetical protein GY834_07570 [Bacteroidetes bacterium]|jgi:hypothetical protein|nr:hypothetical protein [Bacteroidota bacterium]